jgi:Cu/Ag efflux pump CusA
MNTYTWLVDSIDCIPSLENKTNVVSVIHWRVNGTDGTHNATTYGTQPLTYTTDSSFTEYAGLTLETVIEWVQTAMGSDQVTTIQTQLDKMIDNLANPIIVSPKLPWSV